MTTSFSLRDAPHLDAIKAIVDGLLLEALRLLP